MRPIHTRGDCKKMADTLTALREVVREYDDEWQDWEPGDLQRLASAVHTILYPQRTTP